MESVYFVEKIISCACKDVHKRYLTMMKNRIICRKRFTKEEIKNHRTAYMLGKDWFCDICKTGINYKLAGKWCHIYTMKHQLNSMKSLKL